MRKLWTALAGAIVISVAVAGIAIAENTYEVPNSLIGVSADGKGSGKEPVPTKLKFGFTVEDTENLRPQVVEEYRIAAEGLQSFPDARPTCPFDKAADPLIGDPRDLSRACRKAIVGKGTIHNEFGAPTDRSQKATCDVKITLINVSSGDPRFPTTIPRIRQQGGLVIRIDQYVTEEGVDDGTRCPPSDIHGGIAAPFYDVKIEGIASTELRFEVPTTLTHPSTLDNSVREVASTVNNVKGKVKVKGERRTVGYYSLVGRKGRKRTTRVTFIDESGVKKTATQEK